MKNLVKNSKKLYQKYKDRMVDIVLFGSMAKNKFKPDDIDIAIILNNTKESEILNLREKFEKYFDREIHLNLIIMETMLENPLFKTLIDEGISLIDNKNATLVLLYSLSHNRTMFLNQYPFHCSLPLFLPPLFYLSSSKREDIQPVLKTKLLCHSDLWIFGILQFQNKFHLD